MSAGKHIRHTHVAKAGMAWCGAKVTSMDWVFQDIDHAAYAFEQGTSIPACARCIAAAVAALHKGVDP